ncbi:hypothetical protein PMIN06_012325 [Paraphaeosphaeria minitans]|uniref:EKC/KEOPS complex subunit BUD32 n=1 Tax=Paraphaeosphaeria minitans TaxID=565426 RepID=A0A9P6GNN1_9PLEO|nr:protein kinase-11 [Paraphaeosphaeria minitans]
MAPETIEPTAPPLRAPSPTPTYRPLHALPPPFTSSNLEVLTQGAEALVYRSVFLTPHTPCVVKYRPPKPYRHPVLDRRLTKARLLAEARVLVRCKRDGVDVPRVLGADWEAGWLVLEWVEGRTVRGVLDGWAERGASVEEGVVGLMGRVGRAVGRLHGIGVVHGDLTTSNLMVRQGERKEEGVQGEQSKGRMTTSEMRMLAEDGETPSFPSVEAKRQEQRDELEGDIVLIDFGLASHSTQNLQDEDRAVDLYVLERAFAATHPKAEPLFQKVLSAYGESFKGARAVLKKLEDVRLRGRKRSMLG